MKIGAGGLQALVVHELVISRNNDGQLYLAKEREIGENFNSDYVRVNYHELVEMVAKNFRSLELDKRRVKVRVHERDKGENAFFQILDENTGEILLELSSEELLQILARVKRRAGLMLDSKA